MAATTCPFDQNPMHDIGSNEAMELLAPKSSAIMGMLGGGMKKARGKWRECPSCGFVALFRKKASEA
jgi:hypothetical protein